MFEELNAAFTHYTHFYEVVGKAMAESLESCARLTGDDGHVLNYQGKIIFAVKHSIGNDIEWLKLVDGSPIDI
jgi:hypothetical protein